MNVFDSILDSIRSLVNNPVVLEKDKKKIKVLTGSKNPFRALFDIKSTTVENKTINIKYAVNKMTQKTITTNITQLENNIVHITELSDDQIIKLTNKISGLIETIKTINATLYLRNDKAVNLQETLNKKLLNLEASLGKEMDDRDEKIKNKVNTMNLRIKDFDALSNIKLSELPDCLKKLNEDPVNKYVIQDQEIDLAPICKWAIENLYKNIYKDINEINTTSKTYDEKTAELTKMRELCIAINTDNYKNIPHINELKLETLINVIIDKQKELKNKQKELITLKQIENEYLDSPKNNKDEGTLNWFINLTNEIFDLSENNKNKKGDALNKFMNEKFENPSISDLLSRQLIVQELKSKVNNKDNDALKQLDELSQKIQTAIQLIDSFDDKTVKLQAGNISEILNTLQDEAVNAFSRNIPACFNNLDEILPKLNEIQYLLKSEKYKDIPPAFFSKIEMKLQDMMNGIVEKFKSDENKIDLNNENETYDLVEDLVNTPQFAKMDSLKSSTKELNALFIKHTRVIDIEKKIALLNDGLQPGLLVELLADISKEDKKLQNKFNNQIANKLKEYINKSWKSEVKDKDIEEAAAIIFGDKFTNTFVFETVKNFYDELVSAKFLIQQFSNVQNPLTDDGRINLSLAIYDYHDTLLLAHTELRDTVINKLQKMNFIITDFNNNKKREITQALKDTTKTLDNLNIEEKRENSEAFKAAKKAHDDAIRNNKILLAQDWIRRNILKKEGPSV